MSFDLHVTLLHPFALPPCACCYAPLLSHRQVHVHSPAHTSSLKPCPSPHSRPGAHLKPEALPVPLPNGQVHTSSLKPCLSPHPRPGAHLKPEALPIPSPTARCGPPPTPHTTHAPTHLQVLVQPIAHNEAVGHPHPMWLHRVAVTIVEIANLRLIEVGNLHEGQGGQSQARRSRHPAWGQSQARRSRPPARGAGETGERDGGTLGHSTGKKGGVGAGVREGYERRVWWDRGGGAEAGCGTALGYQHYAQGEAAA